MLTEIGLALAGLPLGAHLALAGLRHFLVEVLRLGLRRIVDRRSEGIDVRHRRSPRRVDVPQPQDCSELRRLLFTPNEAKTPGVGGQSIPYLLADHVGKLCCR